MFPKSFKDIIIDSTFIFIVMLLLSSIFFISFFFTSKFNSQLDVSGGKSIDQCFMEFFSSTSWELVRIHKMYYSKKNLKCWECTHTLILSPNPNLNQKCSSLSIWGPLFDMGQISQYCSIISSNHSSEMLWQNLKTFKVLKCWPVTISPSTQLAFTTLNT